MIAVAVTASRFFRFPVIVRTSLCAVDPIARSSVAGNITAISSTPMPSITRSAGTAKRNGADEIPTTPASTGSPTLTPLSAIGKVSAGETESATCRIL